MSQLINLISFSAEGENQQDEPIEVSRPDPEFAENSERPQETIANQEIADENPEAPNPEKSGEIQENPGKSRVIHGNTEAQDPQSNPSEQSDPTDPSEPLESPEQPLKPSEIP